MMNADEKEELIKCGYCLEDTPDSLLGTPPSTDAVICMDCHAECNSCLRCGTRGIPGEHGARGDYYFCHSCAEEYPDMCRRIYDEEWEE